MVWSLDSAEQARICFKPVLPSTLGGDSVRAEGSCATNFRCPRRCFFAAHRHVQAVSHPRRCLLVGTLQLPLRCVLCLPTLLPRTGTSSTRTSQPVASLMAFGGEAAHVGVAFSDGSSTVYSPIVQSPARQPSLALEQHLLGATAFVFFPLTAQPGGPPLVAATAGTDMRIKVHSVVGGACGASMSGSTAPITALGVLPWQGEAPYALASASPSPPPTTCTNPLIPHAPPCRCRSGGALCRVGHRAPGARQDLERAPPRPRTFPAPQAHAAQRCRARASSCSGRRHCIRAGS